MTQKYIDRLEEYEQLAYDGGYGDEWLPDIGEGLKFYLVQCESNHIKPTIKGFLKYIDSLAQNSYSDDEFKQRIKNIRKKIKMRESSSFYHSLVLNKE